MIVLRIMGIFFIVAGLYYVREAENWGDRVTGALGMGLGIFLVDII